MTTIVRRAVKDRKSSYFDPDFINVLEDHIPLFLSRNQYATQTVAPNEAAANAGDFYSLLAGMKVPDVFMFPTLRANGYFSSTDYDGKVFNIIILDFPAITKLNRQWRTQKSMSKN